MQDKILCKRLAIFSRVIMSTYNEEEKIFVPLGSLSEEKKEVIAKDVHIDVMDAVEDFKKDKGFWKENLSFIGKTLNSHFYHV